MDNNILVIGIAGGSASGKTTLMKNLIADFEDEVTVLSHDNYYKRHDELSYEERSRLNYDEPDAFDTVSWSTIWTSSVMATPSSARYTTSPSTTAVMRPSIWSPGGSSSWRAF